MSSATSTITIRYELNPPKQVEVGNLSTSKTEKYTVDADPAVSQEKYYTALQKAIANAKTQLGNDLTTWRDAVGKAELNKETPKTLKYNVEGGEDEEDEQ